MPNRDTGSRVIDDLAEVIGEDAAMELAWHFRGQRLYVPKDPANEPEIGGAIGDEKARHFCDVFGGTSVPVPFSPVVRWKVLQLADEGLTKREIARQCCIREARVYSILAERKREAEARRQLSMF